eukprot:9539252-Heterocapsa_arctica.AAC.1
MASAQASSSSHTRLEPGRHKVSAKHHRVAVMQSMRSARAPGLTPTGCQAGRWRRPVGRRTPLDTWAGRWLSKHLTVPNILSETQ